MRAGAAGMTVNFHECTSFFRGEAGGGFFQLAADALTARLVVDGEVADPGEIALEGDLGYEVQGKESEDGRWLGKCLRLGQRCR